MDGSILERLNLRFSNRGRGLSMRVRLAAQVLLRREGYSGPNVAK